MSEEPDKRLLSETEWADLMAAEFTARGAPVDDVGKARVWRRLERQLQLPSGAGARTQPRAWVALAAGVVAVVGVAQLLRSGDGWREKGSAAAIPATLTPYVLEQDGSTAPADGGLRPGATVVFRARAAQNGVYALVVSEGGEPPRLAVDEGGRIGAEDLLVTKNGSVYGVKIERSLRSCIVVGRDRDGLSAQLGDVSSTFDTLARESCVTLEARPP